MCQHHDHDDSTQHDAHPHHHGLAPTVDAAAPHDELAECPVMPGSMVIKAEAEAAGLVRDHDGQRYWLCCSSCGPLFDANPDQYATTA